MRNLLRIIRSALKYRWTLAGCLFCSLAVGALWGANIGALYPVIDTVFHGESLDRALERKEAESRKRIAALSASLERFDGAEGSVDADSEKARQREKWSLESRLAAERRALEMMVKRRPQVRRYLPSSPFWTVAAVLAFVMVGTLLKGLFLAGSEILVSRLVQRTLLDLRGQFFRSVMELDISQFQEDRTSRLMSRCTHDVQRVGEGLTAVFGQAVREPLKMVSCLIGAAIISWRLLLVSLVVAPLGLVAMRVLAWAVKRASHESMQATAEMYARLSEAFRGIAVVKAFNMEAYERRRFRSVTREIYDRIQQLVRFRAFLKPLAEVLGIGMISVGLLTGVYLVVNQETHVFGIPLTGRPLTPTALLVFYGMLIGITDPVRKLAGLSVRIHRSSAAADRLFAVIERQPSVRDPLQPRSLPSPSGALRFEGVTFRYSDGCQALSDVTLEVRQGECVALVGSNGSGKSTLIKMIPRFHDPTEGRVRLGDVDLKEVRLRDLRQRIGLVTQTTLLFDDTVLNNIRYGSPEATREQVVAAAERAGAHEWIVNRLEDGYDTIVGEGGGHLSGGQAQRLALARAILRDPEILILDEATSNVDVESEAAIHEALAGFIRGRTTIMVTHRVAALELADRIVVMQGGQILDIGSHEALWNRCSSYRQMHESRWRRTA